MQECSKWVTDFDLLHMTVMVSDLESLHNESEKIRFFLGIYDVLELKKNPNTIEKIVLSNLVIVILTIFLLVLYIVLILKILNTLK